ncbi:hypothetical protein C7S14_1943 [Burkholderia cepacia]|nr:hypothetical protein C7S14_1943 [Burkholderia cepacia]
MPRNTRDRANAGSRRHGHRCDWGKWKLESGIAADACRAPCRQNTCVIRKNSTSSPTGTPSSQAIRYLPMS